MILSGQTIKRLRLLDPTVERTVHSSGLSYGVGPASYDVRLDQDVTLEPGAFQLGSIVEKLWLPSHISAQLADKSTWARQGLSLFNTYIDPGFEGYLTVEMSNLGYKILTILKGTPIAQLIFSTLDEGTSTPYRGKYNHQPAHPVGPIFQ